jgi:hypothetical protein
MKNVTAERVIHDGESRVAIRFPYDKDLIPIVKGLPDARWSKTLKAWHIPYGRSSFEQLRNLLPGIRYPDNLFDDIPVTGQVGKETVLLDYSKLPRKP